MSFKVGCCAAPLFLSLLTGAGWADADQNTLTMVDAARQLTWETSVDNRAQLLVKQETVVAPVAVIYGYGDNAAACEELAYALSQPSSMVGTFECQPVY